MTPTEDGGASTTEACDDQITRDWSAMPQFQPAAAADSRIRDVQVI